VHIGEGRGLWSGIMAKPTAYTEKLADEILRRIASGEPLSWICEEEGMPAAKTVMGWRRQKPDFDTGYIDARAMQADTLLEEILDIVDDGRNDWMEKELSSGRIVEVTNHENIARSKLRAETRFKLMAAMNPKKFGDKTQLDLTNSDGSLKPAEMTDEQKAVKIAAIMAAAARRQAQQAKPKLDESDPAFYDGSDLAG